MFSGRHKGGIHRAQELGHEGYHEMGKKGGLARSGEDPEGPGGGHSHRRVQVPQVVTVERVCVGVGCMIRSLEAKPPVEQSASRY